MPPRLRTALRLLAVAVAVASRSSADDVAACRAAQARGLRFFAEQVTTADPSWQAIFGYLRRRYGIEAHLAGGAALHGMGDGVARPDVAAVYRRIDDPTARIDKATIAALPTAIDRITASALHCDRIPLPAEWVEILGKASRAGAYALTHAVLATEWTVENGCRTRREVATLHDEQLKLLTQLVEQRDTLTPRFESASDLWIEAMAMLVYGGAAARIRPEWIADLLSLQRPDGGWPRHPRATRSDPHTTALALWVVAAHLQPTAPPIRWIAAPAAQRVEGAAPTAPVD